MGTVVHGALLEHHTVGGAAAGHDGALDHHVAGVHAQQLRQALGRLGATGAARVDRRTLEHGLGVALAARVPTRAAVGARQDGKHVAQALVLLHG